MSSVRVSAYYARTASCYFFFYAVKEDRKPQLRASSHLIVGSLASAFLRILPLSLAPKQQKKQHTRNVTQRQTERKRKI
jgi:hypothetical protein